MGRHRKRVSLAKKNKATNPPAVPSGRKCSRTEAKRAAAAASSSSAAAPLVVGPPEKVPEGDAAVPVRSEVTEEASDTVPGDRSQDVAKRIRLTPSSFYSGRRRGVPKGNAILPQQVNFDASCPEENYLTPNVSEEEEREQNQRTPSTQISRPGPSKKKKSNDDMSAEILSTVRDHFKQPKPQLDCCELLGRTVTMKMRGIKDKRLHIMFEKKINDLLFEAEMCALNNQVLTPSPQHYTPVPTPSQQHYTAVTTPSPQHYSAVPTPSPQHYTPVPTPSPQHYAPVPTPSPQHYAPVPTRSPQHYTPVPTPSPQHYTPVSTPSPQEEQNTTSHNNTESAATFISSFTSGFE